MSARPDSRGARLSQVSRLDADDPRDLFALRDAIALDPDAGVRASAILRLRAGGARGLLPYLRDATSDRSAGVREAAFVALARAQDAPSLGRAAYACRHDRGFRVRRMALLFAARTCGEGALPLLALASRDPFWRVRVAARRAGAALDAAVDARPPEGAPRGAAPEAIDDPDPAVAASRLARLRGRLDPLALSALLGHSHQALRRGAIKEIVARGDVAALRAVALWLDDERVPYGPSAAEAVLSRGGPRAAALADCVLREGLDGPAGPLAWAIGSAKKAPAWPELQAFAAHQDHRVRRAVAARAPESEAGRDALFALMGRLLDDDDEETACRAAAWLARTGSRDARAALLAPGTRPRPTLLRSLAVDACYAARDKDGLRSFANDEHGGVRASALSALSALRALTAAELRALEQDADPWVRRAVLTPERAAAALHDASPLVRRAALEHVADPVARAAWAESASPAGEPDASLRAQAAKALAPAATDGATRALLRLARDADLGVRSAAVDALEAHRTAARRLLEAGSLEPDERIAAYTLLEPGGEAGERRQERDARVLAHLSLLDDALNGRPPKPPEAASPPPKRASAHLRQLGKTGLLVHPFGLSGAHGLAFDDFALAYDRGVNLFFWEPHHRELSRFLRHRPGAVVAAGTYHADRASIERDVARALRALKRQTIDLFLAFWVRSVARIDETADTLRELSKRGLVRAVGLSTHDRRLACEAARRGLDVVMVRHSAAHRGAESGVLPQCAARGTGVLTFSNLCYGRMLHLTPAPLSANVTAPDCYRYSISQPGVHACVAAPRRRSELLENLAVLSDPSMPEARMAELRAHGDYVYERSKAWGAETWGVAERPLPRGGPAGESLADWVERPDSISQDL